jgi:hypothetical protein
MNTCFTTENQPRFPIGNFAAAVGKALPLENIAGALHADVGGCTLSVGQEVKSGIPANIKIVSGSEKLPAVGIFAGEAEILGWGGIVSSDPGQQDSIERL